jgi:predicted nucleic acid-binding protein
LRQFFDTNILVYSRDPDDAAKRAVSRRLIEDAIAGDAFVISTQVLVEFYATTLRRRILGPAQALDLVRFWGQHDTVPHTPELLVRGLELHQAHSLSVWDGLIVQAALDARCEVLLSEDLQHGRRFGDLEVANPFVPGTVAHERRSPPTAPAPGSTHAPSRRRAARTSSRTAPASSR